MLLIFQVICSIAVCYWLSQVVYFLWVWRFLPSFSSTETMPNDQYPRLSLIIPACNEGATLEEALRSIFALRYPNLEIVLINDRSTDDTGEIMERLAGADPRVSILHVTELLEGWLGKVHALHKGVEVATGEWLLFTDADVHIVDGILQRAVVYAQREELDHLALLPDMASSSLLVNCAIVTTMRGLLLGLRPWRVQDSEREEAIGVGGFNLVRRSTFDASEGFAWLRMEVADDIGVGYLIKNAGGKSKAMFAIGQLRVDWYPRFHDLVRGLEKNAFAQIAAFRLWRGLLVSVALPLLISAIVLVLWMSAVWRILVWVSFGLVILVTAWKFSEKLKISILASIFSFLIGDLIIAWIVLRSTVLGVRRGGLIWRGTVYDTQALQEGKKVQF